MMATQPAKRRSLDKRLLLLPFTQRWINDNSKRKLAVKSRRVGWTYGEAYDAVAQRKTGKRAFDYWYTCTDKDSAREFVDYCQFFLGLKHAIAEDLMVYETDKGREECWAFVIKPTEDTKIVAMPSRPAALRGKSGDVGCDEFAFHQQPEELYKAAASVTKWGGSIRLWSTHNGDASLFNIFDGNCRRVLAALGVDPSANTVVDFATLTDKAREIRIRPVFSYHWCNIFTAIDQGLVELLNTVSGATYTRDSFLAECREECIGDDHFNQEYGGKPAAAIGQWLSLENVAGSEHSDCPGVNAELTGYEGGPCYVGVDFARSGDYTVVWVLEKIGDVFWTCQVQRIHDKDTPTQEKALADILRSVKLVTCSMDLTGPGLGLYEYTARAFGSHRIHGIHFAESVEVGKVDNKPVNRPVRLTMATALKSVMEERRLRIPGPDDRIRNELTKLKGAYTATGRLTFSAKSDKDGHADHFWALALAVAGASTAYVPFKFMSAGKRAFAGKGGLL